MIFSSNEIKARNRCQSAKATSSNRSRPASGVSNRIYQRTELLEGAYVNNTSPNRKNHSKGLAFQGINTEELAKFKRPQASKTTKSREQLWEENMQLKKEVNKLNEELSILKSKMEVKGKRASERSKQLDMEFEKPLYWGGSKTHLISGIKHQYQKLKKQHDEQTRQINEMKVTLMESKIPELETYIESLEKQNRRLQQKLQKFLLSQNTITSLEKSKQVNSYMVSELEEEKKGLQNKLTELDLSLRTANEGLIDKEKKIMFLEKLIIEKDNREFHAARKVKKLEKTKEQILQSNEELKVKNEELIKQYDYQISTINLNNDRKVRVLEEDNRREIEHLERRIKSLEQDNKHLENAVNKLRMSSSGAIGNSVPARKINENFNSTGSFGQGVSKIKEEVEMTESVQFYNVSANLQENQEPQQLKNQPNHKQRVPQSANQKHSENSKKTRKVHFNEIEEIGELLKYRLIAYKVSYQELRNLFNRQAESSDNFILAKSDEEKKEGGKIWEDEYVTMREVTQILSQRPFQLNEEEAGMLARYMIEDCEEDYVYCDENNENKREVVKSIIKSVVGDYKLPDEEAEKKYNDFIDKYASNFESALSTYYPSGKVSKRKFCDVFKSLGAENSPLIETLLIAKVSIVSANLNELEYKKLF